MRSSSLVLLSVAFLAALLLKGCSVEGDVVHFVQNRLVLPILSYNFDVGPPASPVIVGGCGNTCVGPTCMFNGTAYDGYGVQVIGPNPTCDPNNDENLPSTTWLDFGQINATGNMGRSMAFRVSFQMPTPLTQKTTLVHITSRLCPYTGTDDSPGLHAIRLDIDGTTMTTTDVANNNTKAVNENNMIFRVYSNGRSCEQTRDGCVLDLKGAFLAPAWYDLIVSVNPMGWAEIYINGTLMGRSAGYRLTPNLPYRLVVGSAACAQDAPSTINIRAVDVYPMSLTARNVRDISFNKQVILAQQYSDFYGGDSVPTGNWFTQNDNSASPVFADLPYPTTLQTPVSPTNLFISFDDMAAFTLDLINNNATVYLMGNATFVMDALNTPNTNAIVLPDHSSYLNLSSPLVSPVLGGPMSLQFVFKPDPSQPILNNSVVWACSAINNNIEENRLALYIVAPGLIAFSITLGEQTTFTMVGNVTSALAQPDYALGWYNILVIVNEDRSAYMYNHGFLVGQAIMAVPYVATRTYCFLGRDTGIPFNRGNAVSNYYNNPLHPVPTTPPPCTATKKTTCPPVVAAPNVTLTFAVTQWNSFTGGIRYFRYYTRVLPQSVLPRYLLANNTVSVPMWDSWDGASFSFTQPYFVPDEQIATSILRAGAKWVVNDTSAHPTSASSVVVSTPALSPESQQSAAASSPGSSDLSSSMDSNNVVPVLNQFEGAMLCAQGGYLNLGSLQFCGPNLAIRIQFRLTGKQLVAGGTLFDSGNRLTSPMDNVVIKIGNTHGYSADVVVQVWQNGYTCTNSTSCSFVVPGALHLHRDTDLIVVFSSGNTLMYIDGLPVASSTTLISPPAVERPYSFLCRSYNGPSQDMMIYAFSVMPKPLSAVDVAALNPSNGTTYNFNFVTDDNRLYSTSTSTNASQVAGPFPVLVSQYHMWSADPFNLTFLGLPSDGTSPDINNNPPTTGLYFNNLDGALGDVVAAEATALAANKSALANLQSQVAMAAPLKSSILACAGQFGSVVLSATSVTMFDCLSSLMAEFTDSTSVLSQVVVVATPTINVGACNQSLAQFLPWEQQFQSLSSSLANLLFVNATKVQVVLSQSSTSTINAVVLLSSLNQTANATQTACNPFLYQLYNAVETWRSQMSEKVTDLNGTVSQLQTQYDNDNTAYLQSLHPAFVDLGPMYVGTPFSLRFKVKVGNDIPTNKPVVFLDITNGACVDAVRFAVAGPLSKLVVIVTIYRGVDLFQTFTSSPMDSSRYWIDVFFTMDSKGNVKLFNWGQLVSYGTMFSPIPGIRAHAYVGASSNSDGTFAYLMNSAFQKLQYFPSLMVSSSITSLYSYDKPPLVVNTSVSPLYSVNTSVVGSFAFRPPNDGPDACGMCKAAGNGQGCPTECDGSDAYDHKSYYEIHFEAVTADTKHLPPTLRAFPPVPNNQTSYVNAYTTGYYDPNHWSNYGFMTTTDPLYWLFFDFSKLEKSPKNQDTTRPYNYNQYPVVVPTPFFDFGSLIQRYYLQSWNMFSDEVYATTPGARITLFVYTKPNLIIYKNRETDPSAMFEVVKVEDIDKRMKGVCNGGTTCNEGDTSFKSLADLGQVLYINPPKIRMQYGNVPSLVDDGDLAINVTVSDVDQAALNALQYNFFAQDALSPTPTKTTVTLAAGEYVVSFQSWCNYRFEFVTSLANTIRIGFESEFLNSFTTCFSNVFGTNADSSTVDASYQYSRNPGSSLSYMEGTRGGMFQWKFHWSQTPLSYYMYNIVFDFDASSALSNSQPTQAISLAMYNRSPIEQVCWMTHSLSVAQEQSYTNTNTVDVNWNEGVSFAVAETLSAPGVESTTNTDTANIGFGGSVSFSGAYGSSNTTTQDDTQMLMSNVPAKSVVFATLLAFQGTEDIPYTADVLITYAGGQSEHIVTHGIYNNVRTTSIIVTYSDAKPIDSTTTIGPGN